MQRFPPPTPPPPVIYFAYDVEADTILNFQLGGIGGGFAAFKRRPASHAPPASRRSEPALINRDTFLGENEESISFDGAHPP